MMTVVLTFEDDEQAMTLVESVLDDYGIHVPYRQGTPDDFQQVHGEVMGIYKHPTMFCECLSGKKTQMGFTRGKKWGWWVCGQCSKPKRVYWKNIFEHNGLGDNLLDRLFDRKDESLKA